MPVLRLSASFRNFIYRIWKHVKTDWDRQFVKRLNFIPWLRTQLSLDPIDESSPKPELLVDYIKRRLAFAQNQQKLQAAALKASPSNQDGSSTVNISSTSPTPSKQVSSNPASNSTKTPSEPQSSGNQQLEPYKNASLLPKTQLLDVSVSKVPAQKAVPAYVKESSHQTEGAVSSPEVRQINGGNSSLLPFGITQGTLSTSASGFTSQLGAIADAHMGTSYSTSSSPQTFNSPQAAPQIPALAHQTDNQTDISLLSSRPFSSNESQQQLQNYSCTSQLHSPNDQSQLISVSQLPSKSSYTQQSLNSNYQTPLIHSSSYNPPYINQTLRASSQLLLQPIESPLHHPLQAQNVNCYVSSPQASGTIGSQQYLSFTQKTNPNGFYSDGKPATYLDSFAGSQECSSASISSIDPALTPVYGLPYCLSSNVNFSEAPPSLPAIPPAVEATFPKYIPPTEHESGVTKADKPSNTQNVCNSPASLTVQPSSEAGTDAKLSPPLDEKKVSGKKSTQTSKETSGTSTARGGEQGNHYDRKAWKSRLSAVRSELDHILKLPSRAASKLVKILSVYSISPTPPSGDWSTIPPEGRLEVLTSIKASASKEFYCTWALESKGLEILESWLKGAVHAHEKAKPKDSSLQKPEVDGASQTEIILTLLLQILEKIPITVENLKHFSFAKQVLRVNKEANSSKFSESCKRLSTGLEQLWRRIARGASASVPKIVKPVGVGSSLQVDSKKRGDQPSEPCQPKKRKVETVIRASAVSTSSTAKVAESFGRIDKAKLPAFTKKKNEPAPAVVLDPFAEAMAALKGPTSTAASQKANWKPVRRVTFAPDEKLCQVKIVERLVYEGEEIEMHPVGDARKMDAVEGRFLHHGDNFLEEEIEWEVPAEVELTPETISNLETSPLVSPEAKAQDERERGIEEIIYGDETEIPETPGEPAELGQPSLIETDAFGIPKIMKLGGDLLLDPEVPRQIARAQADSSADAPVATDNTVSDLLARLGSSAAPVSSQIPSSTLPAGLDISLLSSFSQNGSLQALFATSGSNNPPSTQAMAHVPDPYLASKRDNGWGAAAGSARQTNRDENGNLPPYIPSGPSAGVTRSKRNRKNRKDGEPRSE
ncbi:hypothetical protein PPACK8108_LOCUS21816 [Phakopsora pachyrhizi]|uniref:TFIIS N-terminal domain-containing protein n=1 Tax=Phakopsora pachyrhizi TaxID=170000 RepID=A0AAV0BLV3_PHAPC|nr:hypothetical protein PPACK8108_LOCUS21816 [Phakopsora pachyrhizi]